LSEKGYVFHTGLASTSTLGTDKVSSRFGRTLPQSSILSIPGEITRHFELPTGKQRVERKRMKRREQQQQLTATNSS